MIMITQRTHHRLLLLLTFAWLVVHVQAKGGGGGGKGGGRGGKSGSKSLTKVNWSTGGHFFLPASAGGRPYDASKDNADNGVKNALQIRQVHGIIAAIAFVGLFPVGAVLKRILPRKWAGPVHSLVQWFGWVVWFVAAILGMVLMGVVDELKAKERRKAKYEAVSLETNENKPPQL
ncbi:hypothetical protein N0V88_006296 [Collariella sp. IMI 366227]|nr:hypothetical protein N0V88_006296 [Collariella sp. IMI 366227]